MSRRRPAGDPAVAIAYVRVSTDRQDLGPQAQRAAIAAWAKARGARVIAIHEDRGVSGAAPVDRCPGLLAALSDLKVHGAGLLVVAKRDRLARDVVKAAVIEAMAQKAGGRVVSADGVAEGDDPAAALMRQILDAFSQFERAQIAARIKAALAVKREKGERVGTIPYGYRAGPGKLLVQDDAEQKALARAARLRARGLTLRAVGRTLLAEGYVPRGGRKWHASTIARLLRRPGSAA